MTKWLIKGDNSETTSNALSSGQFSYSANIFGFTRHENDKELPISAYPITEETEDSLKPPEAENDRVYKKRKTCLPNTTQIRPDTYSTGDTHDNKCDNGDKFSGKPQRASFRLSFDLNSEQVQKKHILASLKSASFKEDNELLRKLFKDTTLTITQTSTPKLGLPLEVPLYWYFHALYSFGPDKMHDVICWCLQHPTEITVDLKKESKCWLFGPKLDFTTTHWVNFVNNVNTHLGVPSYCAPKFTPCEQTQNTQPFVLFNQLTSGEDLKISLSPPYRNIKLDTKSFWSQLKRQVDGNQWHPYPMQGSQDDLEQVHKYQQAVIRAKKEEEERKRNLEDQIFRDLWKISQSAHL